MGLRTKFNLVILAAFAVGFAVAAVVLYRVVNENAREQVFQSARIMIAGANAVRNYTSSDLAPLLPTEHAGRFVPERVPAFAAQKTFKQLQNAFPGYAYREAALNPTNLVDRANDWEADIIRAFRDEPSRHGDHHRARETPTGQLLHLAGRSRWVPKRAGMSQHAGHRAAGLGTHLRNIERVSAGRSTRSSGRRSFRYRWRFRSRSRAKPM
jgi:protein-histidine pros-kinase